jgi:iron complex transport system substrate-binding protein
MSTRLLGTITALCLALVFAAGCGSTPTAVPPTATASTVSVTVTDFDGRTVTISKPPARIVSIAPSATESLFALGLGSKVVGVTDADDYPPEVASITKVGGYPLNYEVIASLSPDLVVGASTTTPDDISKLESLKLTVLIVDAHNVQEVASSIVTLGQAVGAQAQAQQIAGAMTQRLSDLDAKLKGATTKPRVFFEVDNTLYTVGPGSFIDDMITRAGGANIASDAKSAYPQLSLESLVSRDPEVIILSDFAYGETAVKVAARPGWSNISAVRNGRIVEIKDPDLVSRPGPRTIDGLELMAQAIHPELFK